MLGWLKSALNWGIGSIKDLWNKVLNVINAVYGYVDGWLNALLSDINDLYQWASRLVTSVENWTISLYNSLNGWISKIYGDMQKWISSLWDQLYGDIVGIGRWATQQLDNVIGWILAQLDKLESWVIQNIWNPLWSAISGTVNWIAKYGYWAYYMVTHPDQLAAFIAKWILASWINLGKRYAGAFGRWMVHTALSAAGDVAGIIEDILAAII
jgi:predicted PurR-regulated permease PerM